MLAMRDRTWGTSVRTMAARPRPLPFGSFVHMFDCWCVRFDIADRMRERGWVVPAYTLAPGAEHIRVLRALCREDFSIQSAEMCASPHCIVPEPALPRPALVKTVPCPACTLLA
jgi:hypothetical protein